MTTQQETFEMLKYGYIRSLTLLDKLEDEVPGIIRNFDFCYHDNSHQDMYDRNHKFALETLPDGMQYTKEIRHILAKSHSLGYKFTFMVMNNENNASVTMKFEPTHSYRGLMPDYNSKKNYVIKSRTHFYELVVNWQNFVETRIKNLADKSPTDPYEITSSADYIYGIDPNQDRIEEHYKNVNNFLSDVYFFNKKLSYNMDTIKSFG